MRFESLLAGLVLVAAAVPAQAAVIVQQFTPSTGPGGFINVARFNPALGTLMAVEMDMYAQIARSLTTIPGEGEISVTASGGLSLSPLSDGLPSLPVLGVSLTGTHVYPAGTRDFSAVAEGSRTGSTTENLSAYLGTGSMFYLFAGGMSYQAFRDGVPFNPTPTSNPFGIASITVRYVFSEGPYVPEPATWAMMLAGFGAVGGAMRRRPWGVRSAVR